MTMSDQCLALYSTSNMTQVEMVMPAWNAEAIFEVLHPTKGSSVSAMSPSTGFGVFFRAPELFSRDFLVANCVSSITRELFI